MENWQTWSVEIVGWSSTAAFLISIVHPRRDRLHQLGLFTAVTTAYYAYQHGATAIWVKWIFAFFFHGYMLWKLRGLKKKAALESAAAEFTAD